jgi:hypothetical protein
MRRAIQTRRRNLELTKMPRRRASLLGVPCPSNKLRPLIGRAMQRARAPFSWLRHDFCAPQLQLCFYNLHQVTNILLKQFDPRDQGRITGVLEGQKPGKPSRRLVVSKTTYRLTAYLASSIELEFWIVQPSKSSVLGAQGRFLSLFNTESKLAATAPTTVGATESGPLNPFSVICRHKTRQRAT